jgi:uncharacterized protein (DUF1697 family)
MVVISMLRGINVGGHNLIKMDALREVYGSLGFSNARTHVQSGNVVFTARTGDLGKMARRIEDAIEAQFACRPDVILRTVEEMRSVLQRNPFAIDADPAKLIVTFLASEPEKEAHARVRAIEAIEKLHLEGRELFVYYPDGMGRSKLTPAMVDKALKMRGTGRNWNSVRKLLEMAEEMTQI